MTGYIVLAVFAVFVFSVFSAFLFGYTKGRAKEQAEQKEKALRKAESDRAFEAEKESIRREVFNHAENEKANLSSGAGRDRFDNINDSLRDNKG